MTGAGPLDAPRQWVMVWALEHSHGPCVQRFGPISYRAMLGLVVQWGGAPLGGLVPVHASLHVQTRRGWAMVS